MILPKIYQILSFFHIFTYAENCISPAEVVKVSILANSFEGDPFILVFPHFVKLYLLFIFAYFENFMFLARVIKKFEFWRPHLMRGDP